MAISKAIDSAIITRAIGYKLISQNFNPATGYLPQRIAVLGEKNTAQQAVSNDPFEAVTAKQVGDKYGYGSPLHAIMRILKPINSSGVGGVPIVFYPQDANVAATAGIYKLGITVASTVTKSVTHKLYVNGRNNVDGESYDVNLVKGENQAAVLTKFSDAINAVQGAPATAVVNAADVDITTKWKGATAILSVRVDTQDEAAGVVYAETSNTAGTGATNLTSALALFGNNWNTIVINSYGSETLEALETVNGIPDPVTPTGNFSPTNFKPFVALFGSLLDTTAAIEAITDVAARKTQVTNVLCPAPNSEGFAFEAAANAAVLQAVIAQNSPHLGIGGLSYPDMPIPADEDIGDFATIDGRNATMKKGSSTCLIENNKFTIQDFVSTYHPDGDANPKFRYTRDLIIDFNIGFGWKVIMIRDIQDKAIAADDASVIVGDVIKPKMVKGLAIDYIKDRESLALIVNSAFSISSLSVGINGTKPARLDIAWRYQRSSTANQVSTDVSVDFAYSV